MSLKDLPDESQIDSRENKTQISEYRCKEACASTVRN